MIVNVWLLFVIIWSYGWGQQQEFLPMMVSNPGPVSNQIPTSGINWQQPIPPSSSWMNMVPAGTYPGQTATYSGQPQYHVPENLSPAGGVVPDPKAGGVALNLIVNAGPPGISPAPVYPPGPPAPISIQQPSMEIGRSNIQSQPSDSISTIGNSKARPDPSKKGSGRDGDLPAQIVIDGHPYKLNEGGNLVVHENDKRKHNDDDEEDDDDRNHHHDDSDWKHHHDDDDNDDDYHRHTDHDHKHDDDKKTSHDDKPKKKEAVKPAKKPVAKLPELPSTPEIPSVPTIQPQVIAADPTKPPIYPGQNPDQANPISVPSNSPAPISSTDPAAATATVKSSNPGNVSEVVRATPIMSDNSTQVLISPDKTAISASVPEKPVISALQQQKAGSHEMNDTETNVKTPIMPAVERNEIPHESLAEPPSSGQQSLIGVATLAPLSLPQNPGQWASPLPKDQRFESAKANLAAHPAQQAPTSATNSRPGQMPDLPNLPPGMQSFHQRPDAVKKPPSPPNAPMPKPMMPKPKIGSLNSSNPIGDPSVSKANNAAPAGISASIGTSSPKKSTNSRPDPVPAIFVPEAAATVVDTPAPTTTPVPTPAPTPEPTKKSKWAFGHGPEYNYEPSTGRKPADQTNGNPFGKKSSDKEQSSEKGKKSTDGKKKGDDGNKSKDEKQASSGSADQNKAVSDMFSNIMGKIKFK